MTWNNKPENSTDWTPESTTPPSWSKKGGTSALWTPGTPLATNYTKKAKDDLCWTTYGYLLREEAGCYILLGTGGRLLIDFGEDEVWGGKGKDESQWVEKTPSEPDWSNKNDHDTEWE